MARVLVVDDDDNVRSMVADMLSMGGHSADAAADGRAALELARKNPYDLVILDRNMPGMDGLQVLAALRASAKPPKVLMCTASGLMSEVDEALSAGAVDYIVKPIDFKRLVDKIAKHAKPA